MNALVFALFSSIGWGSGDIFGTIASRKIGGYITTLWQFITGAILFSLYIPFALPDLHKITLVILGFNILFGLLYIAGNVAFNEALRISKAPLVGPIAGSFTAVTTLLSVIFLGETLSFLQVAIILTIFAGVLIATVDFQGLIHRNVVIDNGVFYALFAMVTWGIYFAFLKLLMAQAGWFWPNYISILLFPLIYVYMKIKRIHISMPKRAVMAPIALSAILIRGGDFSMNISASMGLTSVVAPIAGAYPVLFTILSFLVFKDPIKRLQLVGIITLAGIVSLGIVSS